ncbi:helix-turn-helix domain-containing protein [Aureibaculum sp. A20]|uniref:Helix-turn-helix domain-containing protein n=1 Tax=Aureibaculum flavum TaxID=2795986 RepID=A0ABS0WRB2_9FLAO|nr:helix-turn-helix domain-containing protein [Aureibaculum flavum]MBJ2174525.1 helix-turn-helix domain-containing protein [Aureibaculum flavum]
MKNQNFSIKIKDLRNRKGFSQEQLSEASKLSLRTIQRIEKGESIPRGDTLIKLTQALGVTPDELLVWAELQDKGYLTLLNLSAMAGLLFHPILGIIIPLVMWILKKDKIKFVDNYGKRIISFQITWTLLIYSVFLIATKGSNIKFDFNIFDILSALVNFNIDKQLIYIVIIGILYLYNLSLIFKNLRRIKKEKESWYFPAISFLK